MELIKAVQKDEVLLNDIRESAKAQDGFNVWWLGQSGFLIQWQNKHLLLDPYLSDSLTKKYDDTDKQHIRMTELVIDPSQLDFIDIVTSSHNHTDHLDGETLLPLIAVNPNIQMLIPRANQEFVANRIEQGHDWVTTIDAGESISLPSGFKVTAIPAAHNDIKKNEKGECHFLGYVFEFGEYTIYHSGDTLWRDEIIEALRSFNIDIAFLPINGNKPERRVAGNLDAEAAVRMGKELNVKMVIPCHYHMFTFNTVDPDEFVEIAEREGQDFKVMGSGEKYQFLIK